MNATDIHILALLYFQDGSTMAGSANDLVEISKKSYTDLARQADNPFGRWTYFYKIVPKKMLNSTDRLKAVLNLINTCTLVLCYFYIRTIFWILKKLEVINNNEGYLHSNIRNIIQKQVSVRCEQYFCMDGRICFRIFHACVSLFIILNLQLYHQDVFKLCSILINICTYDKNKKISGCS